MSGRQAVRMGWYQIRKSRMLNEKSRCPFSYDWCVKYWRSYLYLKQIRKESTKGGFNAGMKYFQKKSNIVWLSKRSYRTLWWADFWLNKKDNDKVKDNEKMTCDNWESQFMMTIIVISPLRVTLASISNLWCIFFIDFFNIILIDF